MNNEVLCMQTIYDTLGNGTCQAVPFGNGQIVGTPCDGKFSYLDDLCPSAEDGTFQTNHLPNNYKPGCQDDPFCTGDNDPRELSAAGRGFAAVAYDPVADEITVHGGTTGCDGSEVQCSPWLPLLRVDGELRPTVQAEPYFASATDVVVISPSDTFTFPPASKLAWDAGWTCAQLMEINLSSGVHHTSGATLGVTWDPTIRSWSADGAQPFVVGGTRFQVVPPGWQHVTGTTTRDYADCKADSPNCTGDERMLCATEQLPGGLNGETERVIASCGNDSMGDGIVTGSVVRLASFTYGRAADNIPRVHSAAAAALDPDHLAVVGGVDAADALHGAWIVDRNIMNGVLSVTNTDPRYGASAVWDPLYNRTIYFGGHDTSIDVRVIRGDDSRDDLIVDTGSWSMSEVRVSLSWDPSTNAWTVDQDMDLTYDCEQQGEGACWATKLDLNFQTNDPEHELWASGSVSVQMDTGGGLRPLDRFAAPGDVHTQTNVTFALPRVVGGGATVHVHLAGWARDDGPQEVGFENAMDVPPNKRWAQGVRPFTFGDPSADAWIFAGLPMWTRTQANEAPVVRLTQLDVQAPAGMAIVATGVPQHLGGVSDDRGRSINTYTDTAPIVADRSAIALMVEGVSYVASVTPAELPDPETTYNVWMDRALQDDERADVTAYVTTDGENGLLGDVEFLRARLGPLEAPDPSENSGKRVVSAVPVLFVRQQVAPTFPGVNHGGISVVQGYTAKGYATGGPFGDHATATHEIAHNWFGGMRRGTNGVGWLIEGMPALLELMRYHSHGSYDHRDMLKNSLNYVESEPIRGHGRLTSLIERLTPEIRYQFSAYTLAQYHFVARGADADADVWRRWADLLHAKPYGTLLEEAEVRAMIGDPFYSEWIQHGRIGTPLLKVDYAQVDPEPDTGTALNMCAHTSPDRIVVKQVQKELYSRWSWPLFHSVPYYLACPHLFDTGIRAIVECDGTGELLDSPHDNSNFADSTGAVQATRYTPATASSASIDEAVVGLVSAHLMLPEHAFDPPFGSPVDIGPVTSVCLLAADSPRKCDDFDSDCWPGDCDDFDKTVNSGATDRVGDTIDRDCDGWGLQ